MLIRAISILNFLISSYGLFLIINRIIDGFLMLNKFDFKEWGKNGADIGANITVVSLNFIIFGVLVAWYSLEKCNAYILMNKIIIVFYMLNLFLIDFALLFKILHLTDVR